MVEIALLLAMVAAWWLSRRLFRDVFTPLSVYVAVWCGCLLLFRARLIDYDELETRTAVMIGASIVAFALGCMLPNRRRELRERPLWVRSRHETVLKVLVCIHLIAFVFFLQRMDTLFGLQTYADDPSQIRAAADEWMKLGALGPLVLLHFPVLVLSFLHILRAKILRWFSVIGIVVPIIQELLWTGRGTIVLFCATMFFMWIYERDWRRVNRKLILTSTLLLTIMVAFFLGFGLIYGKLISLQENVYQQDQFNVTSEVALLLANPYMYATGSFPTLQAAMADVQEYSLGARTFYPAARALANAGIASEPPEWTKFDFYFVPVPFNTYTYLFTFYLDFGFLGAIVGPLLFGYLQTRTYLAMRARHSAFTTGASAVFAAINLFTVFVPLASSVLIWNYFAVTYLAGKFIELQPHRPALKVRTSPSFISMTPERAS